MTEHLFSYGTLQDEKIQLALFGRNIKGINDKLPGYKLSTIENKSYKQNEESEPPFYLIALPSNNSNDLIDGMILELTTPELLVADAYESDDYRRVEVFLQSGKKAWVYIAAR